MRTHVEIEAKYDLAEGAPLPGLTGVGGVDAMVAQAGMVLTATYFDTAGHGLAAAGATLRRRTGGTDDGWHLKIPLADGERLEVHRALGRGQSPPAALAALVRAFVRSERLEAVATLVTERTVHHLRDPDGRVLAELADDSVTGERHDVESELLVWRELEIELVEGDRAVLGELDAAVRAAGVVPATGASKVGRVLGGSPARPAPGSKVRRSTPVDDVLGTALRRAGRELLGADPLVRLDRPDAPARMRAASRRLRAALALQLKVIPDEATTTVRSELAWLDTVVAGVEELDTAHARIREALAAEPTELVLGPVARRVDRELGAARRTALEAVREALDSPRYLELLDGVVRLPTPRPTGDAAAGRAGAVLPALADSALRRAERRLGRLRGGQPDDHSRWRLRGAQRAVERARYAVRVVPGWTGPGHVRLETALAEVASVLAQLEASVGSQEVLRDLAGQARVDGDDGFTFGRLHGLEQLRATELHRRLVSHGKQVKRLRKALSG